MVPVWVITRRDRSIFSRPDGGKSIDDRTVPIRYFSNRSAADKGLKDLIKLLNDNGYEQWESIGPSLYRRNHKHDDSVHFSYLTTSKVEIELG